MIGRTKLVDVVARRGSGEVVTQSSQPSIGQKFLIIDDDPIFCQIISKLCNLNGIASTFLTSLKDLDSVNLSDYTAGIIDVHLDLANGVEVAECISAIVPTMPLMMISTSRFQAKKNSVDSLPFMHKSEGPQAIIEATTRLRA